MNNKEVSFQIDKFGLWSSLSPEWREATGFKINETLGSVFVEQMHPDDREKNQQAFIQLSERKAGAFRFETRFVRRTGEIRWANMHVEPRFDQSGEFLGVAGTLADVTEEHNAEEHIRSLAAVGQFAAGIAHDFNNALAVIQGHADLLLTRGDAAHLAAQLKQISSASRRAADLTAQLVALLLSTGAKKLSPSENGVSGDDAGHGETILVVEDEPELRWIVKAALQQSGYNVIEASDGAEALRVWERIQSPVDLLLTDVFMPHGLTGIELAKRIQQGKPDLKVIYTSGYNEQFAGDELSISEKIFLGKPYTLQKLTHAVHECLGGNGNGNGNGKNGSGNGNGH